MHWFVERILVGRPDRQTIAKYAEGSDRYLGVFLLISAALLGLALTQPIMTSNGFAGLDGSFSLLSAMAALLKSGQGGIALLIAVLSILLPIVLLSTAFELWYKYELTDAKFLRKTQLLRQLGRLWFLSLFVIGAAIYLGTRADSGLVLHVAVYYLLLSLAIQKLVAARLQPMINAVQFVDEDES
ncbi:paraquat-inducible protein A [Sneathiella sp. CAU 1612]|uniref:Paraquat-inducible protein A n=1 Tax=Sneathiella sedimenti TaxID=2816034 RepID=A0ABS3F6T4_9PROT|nr:paraquat-inducible protein A [Sneathiella sedimenti]MBO0334236.1 paraquat-inducible protein A [Sneathiella sedimenti]